MTFTLYGEFVGFGGSSHVDLYVVGQRRDITSAREMRPHAIRLLRAGA